MKPHPDALEKMPTGISGFDDITGGLPLRRTTLLMGGPGCGKTVFALQILVKGATEQGAPGIFVAFEENARRISRMRKHLAGSSASSGKKSSSSSMHKCARTWLRPAHST